MTTRLSTATRCRNREDKDKGVRTGEHAEISTTDSREEAHQLDERRRAEVVSALAALVVEDLLRYPHVRMEGDD